MKIKQFNCDICGSEIDLHYITPTKIFRVNEEGKLVRDDNNEDTPNVEFLCSEDLEHDFEPTQKYLDWSSEIEREFYKNDYDL